ncbi:WXG100 family type VII secretion target [Nonomuraea sp. NPDC050790]|uniref:WXG100 family type VII secretion target n=1 Tax=Nonomuraea sp. NPDC050790 TaxID=3364371 RepID=UPI0037B3E260
MSYENGTDTYYAAAGAATFAATFLIRRPWAFYVAALIGVMISNPAQMADSGRTWRTTDNGGTTSELNALKTELDAMRTALGDKWQGAAFEQFVQAHDGYIKSLESLKSTRNATGEAVDQSAKLYYAGAIACASVAGLMMVLGGLLVFLRRHVFTSALGEELQKKFGRTAVKAVKNVALKLGIAGVVIALAFKEAVRMSESAGKMFPTVKGIPSEFTTLKSGNLPEFTGVALDYDKETGALVPKVEDPTGKGGAL